MKLFKHEFNFPLMADFVNGQNNFGIWGQGDWTLTVKWFRSHSSGSYEIKSWRLQIFTPSHQWQFGFIWRWDFTRKRWKETNAAGREATKKRAALMAGIDEFTSWNWIRFPENWPHISKK